MGLTNELRYKVFVYGPEEYENDLGEDDRRYVMQKSVYAGITVTRGGEQTAPDGSVFSDITHKFTLRRGTVPELTSDTYFVFNGQKYRVKYFYPHYKCRDRIEVFCRLEVDG